MDLFLLSVDSFYERQIIIYLLGISQESYNHM